MSLTLQMLVRVSDRHAPESHGGPPGGVRRMPLGVLAQDALDDALEAYRLLEAGEITGRAVIVP